MTVRRLTLDRHTLIQFGEYLVGGGVYFWSGYAVFALCYSVLGWGVLPAKIAADVVGWTANYLVQRYWAFNNKGLQHHEGRTIGRYALLTVGNLMLDYLIVLGLYELGVTPYIAFFISAGFFTIWNYLWYRFWVFYANRNLTKKVEV